MQGGSGGPTWLAGQRGIVQWHRKGWRHVVGAPENISLLVVESAAKIWLAGDSGLWLGERPASPGDQAVEVVMAPVPSPVAAMVHEEPIAPQPYQGPLKFERLSLAIAGQKPLTSALEVAVGLDGTAWFRDRRRIVSYDGKTARVLATRDQIGPWRCHQCLAPQGAQNGWLLGAGAVHRFAAGARSWVQSVLPAASALAASVDGSLWLAAGVVDDAAPPAASWGPNGWRHYAAVPAACYAAVASSGPDEAWFAGGLRSRYDGRQRWPAGEGLLVHLKSGKAGWLRVPTGALLAVSSPGAREAWAVGAVGTVAHVKADRHEQYRLQFKGGSPQLRTVWSPSPDEAWIGGDDGTLVHRSKQGFRAVVAAKLPLPARAAIASIAGQTRDEFWVASPEGLVRASR